MVSDLKSKAVLARVVVAKAVVEKGLIVDLIVKDFAQMACSRATLKSGSEPAVVEVLQE